MVMRTLSIGLAALVLLVVQTPLVRAAPDCEHYAAESLVLQGKNLAYNCGYSGPHWTLDGREYYNFCISVGPRAAARERIVRAAQIRACR